MVFSAHMTVLQLITTVWAITSEISYLREFKCTKTTNRVISSFDRFTDYYNRMSKNFKNLLSPWVQCTSITNRVLSSIDRFTAYYNCMRKKFKNLITAYVKYTSITNRFLSSFDRFTAFYNCMSKTSKISPWFQCTRQIVFQLIWRFTAYYNCMRKNFQKSHISVSSVHKYHKWCS